MIWISRRVATAIHDDAVSRFGGSAGLRDEALLESALARPITHLSCVPDGTVAELAAIYVHALTMNHPFVDGNKRTALGSALVFTELNGARIVIPEVEIVEIMEAVASSEITIVDLTRRIDRSLTRPSFENG